MQAVRGGITTRQSRELARAEAAEEVGGRKPRASRFEMRVPLRYRVAGEGRWHAGEIENISNSGVRFRGQWTVKLNALLDLQLQMPMASGEGSVEMVCRAVVIRFEPEAGADSPQPFAAKFLQCRWARS